MADPCGINKIDSNIAGLSIAEEECLKQLPGVNGVDAQWFEQESNSYADFGVDTSSVVRAPISATRQRRKGTITDIDASGGMNTDVTFSNTQRLMQGFCFADARESPTTESLSKPRVAVSSVAADGSYTLASNVAFNVGALVLASSFSNPLNNGIKTVGAVAGNKITMSAPAAIEAAPPARAKLQTVGVSTASGDLKLTASPGSVVLSATALDLSTLGLIPGQWIFIGDDVPNGTFEKFVGYARIGAIVGKTLVLDKTSMTAVSDDGAGKNPSIYWGTVVRNENSPELIKRRSYQLERTLGEDLAGPQAEYLIGAVANEFTLNVPQADKLNCDMSFVACDGETRTGLQGLKAGSRIPAPGEDAINTSSDLYQIRMSIVDPSDTFAKPLFAFVQEATVSVNNNVTTNKALGVTGAFDTTAGDFEVSGSVTAYFTNVTATRAVRQNSDVDMYLIAAARNRGIVYDMPLIALGGGRITVEKDAPITIPLDTNAVQSKFGNTLLTEYFNYLPNVAMPG